MPLIQTESLRHGYSVGGELLWAIDGVSLAIESGEFVAIMGPSGSGKTTFLNLIGCLASPISGRYQLDGIEIGSLSRGALAAIRNTKLGFVFQSFSLLPRTTALENIEVPLLYSRTSGAERRRRSLTLLGQFGLAHRAGHTPSELSGGQQQRVALARALANNPLVLLADEPTGSLDTHTSREIMAILQRLNAERGLTIILVTHEAEIAAYADRIVTFRDGRIVSDESRSAGSYLPRPSETMSAGYAGR